MYILHTFFYIHKFLWTGQRQEQFWMWFFMNVFANRHRHRNSMNIFQAIWSQLCRNYIDNKLRFDFGLTLYLVYLFHYIVFEDFRLVGYLVGWLVWWFWQLVDVIVVVYYCCCCCKISKNTHAYIARRNFLWWVLTRPGLTRFTSLVCL